MNHWLMKSEPSAFGIDDLERARRDHWDGVRNYQARNFIRSMRRGDLAFFYHSNCPTPAIVGLMRIDSDPYPDHTAWDPESPYFDPRSAPDAPRWYMVDVAFLRRLARPITLAELKREPALETLPLLRRGNRLSVMPVTPEQWTHILALESRPTEEAS